MKRYCLALDLKNDQDLIAQYEEYHKAVWPEIKKSILESGIISMDIYRVQNRLFMIMEVDDGFSFEEKAKKDAYNAFVQDWENLMWRFQQPLPDSPSGAKWILMDKIFELSRAID